MAELLFNSIMTMLVWHKNSGSASYCGLHNAALNLFWEFVADQKLTSTR